MNKLFEFKNIVRQEYNFVNKVKISGKKKILKSFGRKIVIQARPKDKQLQFDPNFKDPSHLRKSVTASQK